LHFIIAGVVILVYAIYIGWIISPEYRLFSVIQGLYVVTAFFDISWLFFGLEKFSITVVRNAVIKIFTAVVIFVFVKNETDLWKYILILALANFVGQSYLWLYAHKYVKFCKVRKDIIFSHLPQMLILFIPTIAVSLYNYMDKIMVGAISGTEQLGYFENSEKIIFIASNVIGSLGTVMLPRMSNIIAKKEIEKTKKYISYSMQIVLCISCAMAFGFAGIATEFSVLFWGKKFSACGDLILLLAVVLPIKGYANVLRTQYLIPNKMDKVYTMTVCVGAAINLAANYILIPRMHAVGAAIGTILAELFVCLAQIYFCKKQLPVFSYLKSGSVYLGAGVLMFFVMRLISFQPGIHIATLIIQIVTGAITYLIVCIVYFVKTKNELFCNTIRGLKKKI